MPHRDAEAICGKIDAALDVIGENEDEMRPYLLYQLKQMMGGPEHITLDDCKTSELMSWAALIAPVFSRRLARIAGVSPPVSTPKDGVGNRVLTVVRDGQPTGT